MSKLKKRLTAILLSGMLAIGPASGNVLAADILEGTGNAVIEDAGAEAVEAEAVEAEGAAVEEVEAEDVVVDDAADQEVGNEEVLDVETESEGLEADLDQEASGSGATKESYVEEDTASDDNAESFMEDNQEASDVEETEDSYVEEDAAFDNSAEPFMEEGEVPETELEDVSTDEADRQIEDTSAAEEESEPALIESTDEAEESVRTEAAMGVAASGTCGDNHAWTLDDEGILTISGTGGMTDHPWSDDNYRTKIKQVVIESGVTTIGEYAFSECYSLTSVIIPDSVTSIGEYAFSECSSLTSVVIPDSVTSIGENAFSECSSLTSVTISNSMTIIGTDAFRNTPWLEAVEGLFIFNGFLLAYQGDGGSVTIPNGVTVIRESAFSGCDSLTSVTIPDSVTRIENYAFYCCNGLQSVTIPDSVTHIGTEVFSECANLTDVIIQNSVTSIGASAFRECTSLKSVTISDGVTSIGASAFEKCTNLTNVTIPGSVTDIGDSAFSDCKGLQSVIILEGVTSIGRFAFSRCTDLTSITIPDSVKTIWYTAFYGCSSLTSVTIPEGVTSIGTSVFGACTSLTSIIIPDSVTSIERTAFYNCTSLKSVSIPDSVTSIGEDAFFGCTSLTNVFYAGLKSGWKSISIESGNDPLINATLHCAMEALSIADASITGLTAMTYTGKAIKQTPAVMLDGTILTENTDYTLSYINNTNVGTATVKITGIGKYAGAATATFKINKAAQTITAKAAASSIAVGKKTTVSTTGSKGAVTYQSADKTIAAVDKTTGKVTAKKVGTAKITATAAATDNYKSASKTVTIKIVPAATSSITAANQATGIKLTWKKVTGATGYKVYRGTTLLKTIKSGSTVTYTDKKANKNGTKYTFKVYATASTGTGPVKSVVAYRVARPAISSVSNTAAGKMTVKWGKNAKATGYQIQYSTNKAFTSGKKTVSITKNSIVSKAIGSLKKGKTYYVRVRTYKTVDGTKIWSAWSAAKTLKISK